MIEALDERLERGQSLDEITIESLSDRAGVAAGSFYEYFVSKDNVFGVLIGWITHRNFVELASKLERTTHATLDEHVDDFAEAVVSTYFARPARMRALVLGVGKLGLLDIVTAERDRFAELLARTVKRYLPNSEDAELRRTFCLVADAAMGILSAECLRARPVPTEQLVEEISSVSKSIISARHAMA